VRAKMVGASEAADYRWSSLNRFVHGGRPGSLIAETVLSEAGDLPDTTAGWRKYCKYLAWLAADESAQRERGFERMCQGWSVGTSDFKLAMQHELLKQSASRSEISVLGRAREDVKELREMLWEARLKEEAARLGLNLDRLPSKKSALEKVRLAAVLKANTSVSNGWLANRLHMGKPATVSQYVRRFILERRRNDVPCQ
jgi:putative transposase